MSVWTRLLDVIQSLSGRRATEAALALRRTANGVRFAVDAVAPATEPCPQRSLEATFALAMGMPADGPISGIHVLRGAGPCVPVSCENALVGAVHRAFTEHRPLVLTPDALWLTLAHGVALHNEQHAEALRNRIVRHEGQKTLEIPGPPDGELDAAGWAAAIGAWTAQLRPEVGPTLHDLFLCDFSTSTPESDVASRVLMMSAFRRYFSFEMLCICGIPEVELRGTPEDWRRIRARVDTLANLDLEWWAVRLRPVLDALVATAEGRPDPTFWRQIYVPLEVYGGEVVVGWIAELFPYICGGDGRAPTLRNPLFDSSYAERMTEVAELRGQHTMGGPGLSLEAFPANLGLAPIVQRWPDGRSRDLELLGGLFGVRSDTGGLEPVAGWAVRDAPVLTGVLRRIREEGTPVPVREGTSRYAEGPAELFQLAAEVGGRSLWGGCLTLLPTPDWQAENVEDGSATLFGEVPAAGAGVRLAARCDRRRWDYVLGTVEERHVPGRRGSSGYTETRLLVTEELGESLPVVLDTLRNRFNLDPNRPPASD